MSSDSTNGFNQRTPGSSRSIDEDSLTRAISDMGRTVDQLQISVERQIRELTEYVNQCEKSHQEDMGHWRTVTEDLAQLLKIKTQATQEVSSSYVRLTEYLTKFNSYLMLSETTLSRVEQPLLNLSKALPSLSDGSMPLQRPELSGEMSPKQLQEVLQILSEAKTTHQHMQVELTQTLHQMQQSAIALNQARGETSIWTEVFAWRPAIAWFSIGGLGVAVLLLLTIRMSGFDLAVRSLLSVDGRLQRIEYLFGIGESPNEIPEEDFEEKPMPED